MTHLTKTHKVLGGAADATIAIEWFVFVATVTGSAIVLVGGTYLSCFKGSDPHWMNRAGAAVVLFQVVAAAGEFIRRRRLDSLRHSGIKSILSQSARSTGASFETEIAEELEIEIGRAERNALLIVLGLAALGELFHGFGDLFIEHICR